MDDLSLLEIAQTAVFRLSEIALDLGAEEGLPNCCSLGAELFIVWYTLNSSGSEGDKLTQGMLTKLLRDIERICSVTPLTRTPDAPQYPCMKDLGAEEEGSPAYRQAVWKVRRGLGMNAKRKASLVETAAKHLKKFSSQCGVRRPVIADIVEGPKTTPDEYSTKIKMLAYAIISRHVKCLCCDDDGNPRGHKHNARLLLKANQIYTPEDHAEFEMLFSTGQDNNKSESSWSKKRFCFWQDVQVLVPREKKVGFTDQEPTRAAQEVFEKIKEGRFCDLINLNENSRLCLTIRRNALLKGRPDQLKHIVDNEPGISLSKLLAKYRLSMEMKGALAFILAQSVWQFYESDWMNTSWDSNSIQFIPGASSNDSDDDVQNGLFAWKPYFSVRFGEKDPDFGDCSAAGSGEIHHYPRIRALGVMLVEIGIGKSLENHTQGVSEVAKRNEVWVTAKKHSDSKKPWPGFPFEAYRTAVKHCLEPQNFALLPTRNAQSRATSTQKRTSKPSITTTGRPVSVLRQIDGSKAQVKGVLSQTDDPDTQVEEEAEMLRKRRKMLFEKVVSPLENLVQVCGWIKDLSTLGPVDELHTPLSLRKKSEPEIPTPRKILMGGDLKQSKNWLMDIADLNSKVVRGLSKQSRHRPARIRIAVLDTGFEETVPFFHIPARRSRIKDWKDWVKNSPEPSDIAGHGTHLVSLVMTVAPDADIYVARIAEDRRGLEGASDEIVANAIEWAWTEWKVDIISMSFGYRRDQPKIKNAILRSVMAREEKILYFAAAANFGVREPEMFPARFSSVISMRGSNANGFFPDFNPPPREDEAIVYGTLGVDVPGASIQADGKQEHRSGSSVATAIGAGMAAVLLEYVARKSHESGELEALHKLKTQQGMLAMFKSLAVPSLHNAGHRCVSLQKLLDITENQRWAKFEDALASIG